MSTHTEKSSVLSYETGPIDHIWNNRFKLNIDRLALQAGCSYAILGANGSGKSTLLRILADKLGQFDDLSDPGDLGYLPQNPYSFQMSVEKNVRLGIPPSIKIGKDRQNTKIDLCLSKLGLTHLINAHGHKLSGGEAQRMALARLLIINRKILLLDEPTSSLDLSGMKLAEDAIREYCIESGCMLLLATHQLSLAERLCSHLIFLDDGRLNAMGSMNDTLRTTPTDSLKQFLYYER